MKTDRSRARHSEPVGPIGGFISRLVGRSAGQIGRPGAGAVS